MNTVPAGSLATKPDRVKATNLEGFLDEEQSRYEEQLNEYAQMLGAIRNESIRPGLYFPLMKGWREWGS